MMFLETGLVYPIPPVERGDWSPTSFQFEDVNFTSADGTKLHGWFLQHANSTRAILYCHGNGEDVASVGELGAHLSRELRTSVFVFDYRGYGRSDGTPNEAGCIADGLAAQLWLAQRMKIRPDEVVVMGRSLGGAIALALAAENGAGALILESAFPTMPDVAALHYPWLPVRWIMKNRYDNLARITHYDGPLLQSHGTADGLIPIQLAQTLFNASPSAQKNWLVFDDLGHNDLPPRRYYANLADFLNNPSPPNGHANSPASTK